MSRTLTSAVATAAAANRLVAAYFVELDFASGFVRAWTGVGTISWDSKSWDGVGELGGISVIEENEGVVATGAQMKLSVTDSALLATALGENYQGRAANIWIVFFDTQTLALLDAPVKIFGGVMDSMQVIDEGRAGSITLNCESWMRVLSRSKDRRRTDMDQQSRFSGDLGMEYVPAIQDVAINWGANDAEQTKKSQKKLRKRGR